MPSLKYFRLDGITIDDDRIVIAGVAKQATARCPLCGHRSRQVHSWYVRVVADLPLGRSAVLLRLRVRRFFCRVSACSRRIFTERLPELVAPHGRRSHGLRQALQRIALTAGGEAGARLARALGMPTGPSSLLHLIRHLPVPDPGQPRAVGVDEWAWRRGTRYNSAYKVAQSALEFTVSVPRAPLRERYGSAWKRAAVPRLSEDDGAACARRGT